MPSNGKQASSWVTFLTPAEAEAAYREKAVELRGEFAPQECLRQGFSRDEAGYSVWTLQNARV